MLGQGLTRYLGVLVMATILYTVWVFLRRAGDRREQSPQQSRRKAELERIYGGTDLKILQFYGREGTVVEGSPTTICYGVINARSVRIEPNVQSISPSINRCIEVTPERDTRYTLTAEAHDGRTVSESLLLQVTPDTAELPNIAAFRVASRTTDYSGRVVISLSFSAVNAEEVSIDPPVFPPLYGVPNGQFYVTPRETTTYTLTAKNKRGRVAQQRLTVEIPR